MRYLRFVFGWMIWHVKALVWYVGLAFRLFFAIGLDRDFDPKNQADMTHHFVYHGPKTYRRHLA